MFGKALRSVNIARPALPDPPTAEEIAADLKKIRVDDPLFKFFASKDSAELGRAEIVSSEALDEDSARGQREFPLSMIMEFCWKLEEMKNWKSLPEEKDEKYHEFESLRREVQVRLKELEADRQ